MNPIHGAEEELDRTFILQPSPFSLLLGASASNVRSACCMRGSLHVLLSKARIAAIHVSVYSPDMMMAV